MTAENEGLPVAFQSIPSGDGARARPWRPREDVWTAGELHEHGYTGCLLTIWPEVSLETGNEKAAVGHL